MSDGLSELAGEDFDPGLEVARLKADLLRHTAQTKRLVQLNNAVNRNCDLGELLRLVRDIVVDDFGYDRAGVFSYDPQTETMRGVWGTDTKGFIEDISRTRFPFANSQRDEWQAMREEGHRYILRHFEPDELRTAFPEELAKVDDHVMIPLSTATELVGYIAIDNLLTSRPIVGSQLDELVLFADQATVAVVNTKLREEREVVIQRQRRVMDMTLAINSDEDLDKVFLMVRNAVLESGFFDRASVWIVDNAYAHGTWGTDETGALKDEHGLSFLVEEAGLSFSLLRTSDEPFHIDTTDVADAQGQWLEGVPHAFVPLRAGEEFIGFVAVDTLLTGRKITPAMAASMLPITDQAAVAVQKMRLLVQSKSMVKQQWLVMEIAAAIAENENPDAVFRMVRDAVLEVGCADRVGVWLVEEQMAYGTWGTDEDGVLFDEHHLSYPLETFAKDFPRFIQGEQEFVVAKHLNVKMSNGVTKTDVPFAMVRLAAANTLVGFITIDNLFTMREITKESLEIILPMARQAAVAVLNKRLLAAATQEIERRTEVEALLVAQTEELIVARDEALAGVRAKDEFLATMSHEIRTPLNGVIGLTSLLEATTLSEQQALYLEGVRKSADVLLSIVNDILDFGSLEAGKLTIERQPFSLRDCIREVLEATAPETMREAVGFSYIHHPMCPDHLVGDKNRLRQVVTHVLTNAIKFTHQGQVTMEIACLTETDGEATIRIEVRDTGVGIAEERQAVIFEGFTQVDGSLSRCHGGAGLGLTLTRQIVQLMGGSVYLESAAGVGTTVRLDIPLAKQMATEPETPLGLHVLLAEDNPINAMVATDRLENWGCEVMAVENGREALEALEARPFDLVLMDVSMPEMDGIQATKELRRREGVAGGHIPVIALTAHAMEGDREKCLAAGMDDYVAKPVNFGELLRTVQRWSASPL